MPEYFTPEEVAAQLKYDVQTIRRYLREGRFPSSIKINGSWRIPAAEVTEYHQKWKSYDQSVHRAPLL